MIIALQLCRLLTPPQVIGSVIAIVGVIVVAVVVGVTLARKNSQSSSSSHGNSGKSNLNDPSSFPKIANLSRSFYGLAYTPANSQYPACGNSLGGYVFESFIVDSEYVQNC